MIPTETTQHYRDADLSIPQRVADLLGRMTRAEKLAQLGSAWSFAFLRDMAFSEDLAEPLLEHGLGQVTRIAGATSLGAADAAALANRIQQYLVEHTRLGIPAIVHEEVCSGVMARDTTIFPQAIAVAGTWDPDLNRRIGDAIRAQMRAAGAHQGLSPVLDIARDPRWGRMEETYGEDPYLVARMGVAFVEGLQGAVATDGVVATAKHFVGYGASEGGMNWAPAHLPPRELREVYLHPFEAAVREAGLRSVMNGYHELDGIPCGANRRLLTGILRDEWGFDGIVVSDYFSVDQLADYHRLVAEQDEAAAVALEAGIDVELPGTDCYGRPLDRAVEAGRVDEAALDDAVARVLRVKFALGLFEDPFVDAAAAPEAIDTAAHRTLALEAARKSVVLLKHDRDVLPLASDRRIALIGPNADDARNLLGDYTYPSHAETLLEQRDVDNPFGMPIPEDLEIDDAVRGIQTVLDELSARRSDRVRYARGCDVNTNDTAGFEEAVAIAAEADVAVLVLGDKSGLTDDCTSGESRDRASLDLPGVQEELARAVIATGTPTVAVLVAGRPVGSEQLHRDCRAVVMAWLGGQAGAQAIAEVLTGEHNPGGKLAVSYPRHVGQVPVFYSHKVSGGRSHWKGDYVDTPTTPRYPFGHGLSYTTFSLQDVAVLDREVPRGHSARIRAVVANTGARGGTTVVQLYIRDPEASVTRPVAELKAFARLELEAGASQQVTFELPSGLLGFYDGELRHVVETGRIDVQLGFSAADVVPAGSFEIVPSDDYRPVEKVFASTAKVTSVDAGR